MSFIRLADLICAIRPHTSSRRFRAKELAHSVNIKLTLKVLLVDWRILNEGYNANAYHIFKFNAKRFCANEPRNDALISISILSFQHRLCAKSYIYKMQSAVFRPSYHNMIKFIALLKVTYYDP
jgi:hypothetical protein